MLYFYFAILARQMYYLSAHITTFPPVLPKPLVTRFNSKQGCLHNSGLGTRIIFFSYIIA
jgi:hypothetical protein